MVLAQVQMPLMVLPILTVLQIDPNLADASRGARRRRMAHLVAGDDCRCRCRGSIAGCILTYAACVTAFVTQTLIGGARLIYMPLTSTSRRSAPITGRSPRRLSIVFMVAVLLVVYLF
jgi:putative spermidine/putrescine transport system permease protein